MSGRYLAHAANCQGLEPFNSYLWGISSQFQSGAFKLKAVYWRWSTAVGNNARQLQNITLQDISLPAHQVSFLQEWASSRARLGLQNPDAASLNIHPPK